MPKFKSILELTIKAATQADANDIAAGAAVHILDTFNDDDSIASGIRYLGAFPDNVIVTAHTLRALIEAAGYAIPEALDSAAVMAADKEHDGAREWKRRATVWRQASKAAERAIHGRAGKPTPKKPEAPKAYALIWGGGDEPESPAVMLYSKEADAVAGGVQCMRDAGAERDVIARVRRELKESRSSWEDLPNETTLEIQELAIL